MSEGKAVDGAQIKVRPVRGEQDLPALLEFYRSIPGPVLAMLRYDVTDEERSRRRLRQVNDVSHWRLLAESGNTIVGDATMDLLPFEWSRHVANLRIIVYPDHHYADAGLQLLESLAEIAGQKGIEILSTEVIAEQQRLINALEKTGFSRVAVLPRWVRDRQGAYHDLVVMASNLEDIWQNLQDMMDEPYLRHELEN